MAAPPARATPAAPPDVVMASGVASGMTSTSDSLPRVRVFCSYPRLETRALEAQAIGGVYFRWGGFVTQLMAELHKICKFEEELLLCYQVDDPPRPLPLKSGQREINLVLVFEEHPGRALSAELPKGLPLDLTSTYAVSVDAMYAVQHPVASQNILKKLTSKRVFPMKMTDRPGKRAFSMRDCSLEEHRFHSHGSINRQALSHLVAILLGCQE